MEKLIKLLNEYHYSNSDLIYYGWDEEYERVYFHTELPEEQKKKLEKAGIDDEGIDEQRVDNEWICSKKFGFIKWLVDNDKINFNFVERIGSGDFTYDIEYYNRCTCEDLEEYDEVDRVLMLLAIQDEPIEFLISILR